MKKAGIIGLVNFDDYKTILARKLLISSSLGGAVGVHIHSNTDDFYAAYMISFWIQNMDEVQIYNAKTSCSCFQAYYNMTIFLFRDLMF
mgnify:CR=1 FL=1